MLNCSVNPWSSAEKRCAPLPTLAPLKERIATHVATVQPADTTLVATDTAQGDAEMLAHESRSGQNHSGVGSLG